MLCFNKFVYLVLKFLTLIKIVKYVNEIYIFAYNYFKMYTSTFKLIFLSLIRLIKRFKENSILKCDEHRKFNFVQWTFDW